MEQPVYKYIFAALVAGILACGAYIAWLLLQPAPQAEVYANATLVWEGLRHALC